MDLGSNSLILIWFKVSKNILLLWVSNILKLFPCQATCLLLNGSNYPTRSRPMRNFTQVTSIPKVGCSNWNSHKARSFCIFRGKDQEIIIYWSCKGVCAHKNKDIPNLSATEIYRNYDPRNLSRTLPQLACQHAT